MFYSTFGIFMLLLLQSISSQKPIFDKYTDENRPYKFGFNIDGYQHRNEEKNEKGIIKGEYGFITADGYYRVTKYETDENGSFKIISQKNYYVGFPPENPTTTPASNFQYGLTGKQRLIEAGQTPTPIPVKIVDSNIPVKEFPISSTTESSDKKKIFKLTPTTRSFNKFQGPSGCSHCIIPTTSKPSTSNLNEFSVDYRVGINLFEKATPKSLVTGVGQKNKELTQTDRPTVRRNDSAFKNGINNVRNEVSKSNLKKNDNDINLGRNFNIPKADPNLGEVNPSADPKDERNLPKAQDLFGSTKRPSFGATKSKLPNNLNQINNDNSKRGRISDFKNNQDSFVEDKNKLLYTFNYTLDFHGHHEDGYRNGDKEGDYFFDGKDGTKRNVTYIANEFGYQPNITLVDLNNDERKRFDDNKDNELKGYEFKWFYTHRK